MWEIRERVFFVSRNEPASTSLTLQLPLERPDAGDEILPLGAEAEQAELACRPCRLLRLGLLLEHVGDLLLHLELLALQLERRVPAADPPREQGVVAVERGQVVGQRLPSPPARSTAKAARSCALLAGCFSRRAASCCADRRCAMLPAPRLRAALGGSASGPLASQAAMRALREPVAVLERERVGAASSAFRSAPSRLRVARGSA